MQGFSPDLARATVETAMYEAYLARKQQRFSPDLARATVETHMEVGNKRERIQFQSRLSAGNG